MAEFFNIKVIQDESHAAGHVVLRVSGVERAPLDETFVIRRVGDHATSFESDWPGGPRRPLASEWHHERRELDLLVGPDVVNPIAGGTPVSIYMPGLGNREAFLTWPDGLVLAASRNPRRGQARREVVVPVASLDDASRRGGIDRRREQERAQREDAERARQAQELQQREAAERQREDQERRQREELERQRLAQEQQQREAAERQREDQERRQREELERQRAAHELAQREAVERQRAEQQRRDREEAERQRQDADRQHREAQLELVRKAEAARRQAQELEQSAEAQRRASAATLPVAATGGAPAPPRRTGLVVGIGLGVAGVVAAVVIGLVSHGQGTPPPPLPQPNARPEVQPDARSPPKPSCNSDPEVDYQQAMDVYDTSPAKAERLLRCVIQGSNEKRAEDARRQLEMLQQRKRP